MAVTNEISPPLIHEEERSRTFHISTTLKKIGIDMKISLAIFLALSGYLHADAMTGWEIVENAKSVDAAIGRMENTVKGHPYVMLIHSDSAEEHITGTIIAAYRGEFHQGQQIRCEAPQDLYKVQEPHNEYTSEMFVLCQSVTRDDEGTYVLHDVIVIPKTRYPFLPEVALRIALRLP